ncbi:MAG: tol-pal system protein YbgF [Pseudomonadota bacterium]
MHKLRYCLVAAALSTAVSAPLYAAENVEQRLQRVERLLESQSLLDMAERIDTLQSELQLLRGQLEEQQYAMDELKDRQRELYLDIDRRISRLERERGGGAPAGQQSSPAIPQQSGGGDNAQGEAQKQQRLEQERAAYQEAFDLLRELRYAQATAAFRGFLKEYPDSNYAHTARYWLAEAAYAQRNFSQAVEDYRLLIANYPESPKRAEAMLKIGYSQYELKQMQQGRQTLEALIKQYPDSTEAGQARSLLRQIRKNGG